MVVINEYDAIHLWEPGVEGSGLCGIFVIDVPNAKQLP